MRRLGAPLAVALLGALAACGRGDGKAQTGPYAREVARAIPSIERGTGLRFKRAPVLQTRTRAQVRAFLEERFRQEISDSEITGQEILYRRLGLIPDTLDLRRFMLNLLTEQVIGFYDPRTKVLYVVDGAPKDQVGFVVAHELVHALQDQYTNLDSIQSVHGDNDRAMAAQAVIEGQATLVPLQGLLGPGANLPAGWDRVREMIREDQSRMPVFASAPLILQETLLFPYLSGAEFMRRFEAERPHEEPFGRNMPISTAQILQPREYFGAARSNPVAITFPPPSTGRVIYSDNLGEFETRLFLFQHLQDQADAVRGAAGWQGDRYEVIRTARGDGIAWLTLWDNVVDAAQFGSDVERVIAARFHSPAAHEGAQGKSYAVAGRSITLWGGQVDGQPAVLYTDLPAGESAAIVNLEGVKTAVESPP